MAFNSYLAVAGIAMEDEFGITYLVETAAQFWSELEDMLNFGTKGIPTLSLLDSTLRRSLALCSAYHEQYLQSPLQLEHACELIIDSELFQFHSERMSEILVDDVQVKTDPHLQLMINHVLFSFGRRRNNFFRSTKRWQPLLPILMDHIQVEIDPEVEDAYFGVASGSNGNLLNVPIPIEAKLRSVSVKLLYEVSRVQKLLVPDLRIFNDSFIDYLFDLVEQTRHMQDETFNYSVIKLIVSLNEQFMVASLAPDADGLRTPTNDDQSPQSKNRVLRVLMRRLGSSMTFGENMIFMLNRAGRAPEDLCMQLLILKLLYVLFTTQGTSEYFYTNDLCVLVDVFLRDLVDLDDDSESLRQTYLRVLHPLLTKTQLRDIPYKRPHIVLALESLIANSPIRDVNPTTRRLVERCLAGEWCVNLTKPRQDSPISPCDGVANAVAPPRGPQQMDEAPAIAQLERSNSRKLKSSRSVEHLKTQMGPPKSVRPTVRALRRPSNASSSSLPSVACAASGPPSAPPSKPGLKLPPPDPPGSCVSDSAATQVRKSRPAAPNRQVTMDSPHRTTRRAAPPPPTLSKRRLQAPIAPNLRVTTTT